MRSTPHHLLPALLSTIALVACASGTTLDWSANIPPPPDVADLSTPKPAPGQINLRVIVQFKEAVAFDEPAFVGSLQAQAGVPVRYLTPVSGDTHVYSLQLARDQSPTPVLERLASLPSVARVELDRAAKAH